MEEYGLQLSPVEGLLLAQERHQELRASRLVRPRTLA